MCAAVGDRFSPSFTGASYHRLRDGDRTGGPHNVLRSGPCRAVAATTEGRRWPLVDAGRPGDKVEQCGRGGLTLAR